LRKLYIYSRANIAKERGDQDKYSCPAGGGGALSV